MSVSTTSVRFGADLLDGAKAQGNARGYESFSAYLTALVRLDTINDTANDHALAQRIGEMTGRKRDQIDAQIKKKAEEASDCWTLVETPVEEMVPALFGVSGSFLQSTPAQPIPFPERRAAQ